MVCHWLHEVVVLGNKSIVIAWNCNLICICKVVAVHSTWLSSFIVTKRRLSCSQLMLSDLLLRGCTPIIIYSLHIFCYYVIFAWHLNIISLLNFEIIWIQFLICDASWIVFIDTLHFVLSDWLPLCIIILFPSWMVCSSIRIICWCSCSLLVYIVCSVKAIFQIINTVSEILLLWAIINNIQTYLALMSFVLGSQSVLSIGNSSESFCLRNLLILIVV